MNFDFDTPYFKRGLLFLHNTTLFIPTTIVHDKQTFSENSIVQGKGSLFLSFFYVFLMLHSPQSDPVIAVISDFDQFNSDVTLMFITA